jgi:hypothetical protein
MLEQFGAVDVVLVLGAILGLVEFMKQVGLSGDIKIRIASMITGVALGVLFQLQAMYPAIEPWFRVAIYGIVMGLTASGLFKLPASMGFGSRAE